MMRTIRSVMNTLSSHAKATHRRCYDLLCAPLAKHRGHSAVDFSSLLLIVGVCVVGVMTLLPEDLERVAHRTSITLSRQFEGIPVVTSQRNEARDTQYKAAPGYGDAKTVVDMQVVEPVSTIGNVDIYGDTAGFEMGHAVLSELPV